MINNLQSILTQNSLMTEAPIYTVYSKQPIVVDEDYDYDKIVYVRDEDELDSEEYDKLESAYFEATDYRSIAVDANGNQVDGKIPPDPFNDEEFNPYSWEKRHIKMIDRFEQAFFIRENAQRFIENQSHNLSGGFIYVESAYRNPEWRQIRQLLIDKARIESEDVSA